jgi:transcriptional regulator with PAS, ATPase and Fis domain
MRDDFYYRLCSDVIVVPPLRRCLEEKPNDLGAMLSHVIERLTGEESTELVHMVQEAINIDPGLKYTWPGNVREMEQAVRRILLKKHYQADCHEPAKDLKSRLIAGIENGSLDAQGLLSAYCQILYQRYGTYEAVSRRTNLDRRTVKRYIDLTRTSRN